eukprot:UC1_evm1s1565
MKALCKARDTALKGARTAAAKKTRASAQRRSTPDFEARIRAQVTQCQRAQVAHRVGAVAHSACYRRFRESQAPEIIGVVSKVASRDMGELMRA